MSIVTNPVGKTNVSVTSLSFGCASIGNLGGVVCDEDATAIMQYAWSAGIRYFDTAPHYGRGLSEQRIGTFLQSKPRDTYVLSTKVGRVLSPGTPMEEADGFMLPLPNAVHYDYRLMVFAIALKAAANDLAPTVLKLSLFTTLAATHTGLLVQNIWKIFLGRGCSRCAI